jgi:hypothetical protein
VIDFSITSQNIVVTRLADRFNSSSNNNNKKEENNNENKKGNKKMT